MAQTWFGNFAPCILPCKIGGSQNLMKERYLSETPFLTFVYLSTCNTKVPGFFGNSKKMFLWTGPVHNVHCTWWRRPEVCKNCIQDLSSKLSCWTDWWKTHSRQIGADEWTGATADGKSTITTSKYYWIRDNHDDNFLWVSHSSFEIQFNSYTIFLNPFFNRWPPLCKCPVRQ